MQNILSEEEIAKIAYITRCNWIWTERGWIKDGFVGYHDYDEAYLFEYDRVENLINRQEARDNNKLAVCVLVTRPSLVFLNGKEILGVSRKNDPDSWGLIGGKVEENELEIDAAIREAKEETGIDIFNLERLYEGYDSGNWWTITYTARYKGTPRKMEEGNVDWITWDHLFSGPFKEYSKMVKGKYESGI